MGGELGGDLGGFGSWPFRHGLGIYVWVSEALCEKDGKVSIHTTIVASMETYFIINPR